MSELFFITIKCINGIGSINDVDSWVPLMTWTALVPLMMSGIDDKH